MTKLNFFMKIILILLLGTSISRASNRSLNCHLSLPAGVNMDLSSPVIDGKALIEYKYDHSSKFQELKPYEINSEVWGFKVGSKSRIAGYLSIKKVKLNDSENINYAINHCELSNLNEKCEMELTVVIDGVGMRANCFVSEIVQ